MIVKKFIMAIAAGALIFTGCKKEYAENPVTPETKDRTIKFTTSLYQFTKATDTSFEENDAIGVNIFTPECYLYNAKYTFTNGVLSAATPNKWYEDENLESTITAVYPFNHALNSYLGTESFTINADQSTKEGYTTSDLLFAVTKAKPTEDAVMLPFKHALSKIVVTLDNQLGEEIAQIWFTDVLGTVSYDPKDPFTMTTGGTAGTIKAYKSGENTWQLIVAPQTASPKLAVTTTSGKQFTFILDGEETFESGKLNTATVPVSKNSIYTSFTPEIEDWTADNELNFSQSEDEEVVVPEPEEPVLEHCRLIIKVNKAIDWYDKYVYSWDANEPKLSGEWPGTKAQWDKEDGSYYVYYYDFPASLNGKTINYIINNGNGGQTKDLSVTLNGAETTVTIETGDKK